MKAKKKTRPTGSTSGRGAKPAKKQPAKKAVRKSAPKNKSVSVSKAASAPGIGLSPLGDKVLIRLFEVGEEGKVLPSGIIIPVTVDKEKSDRGEVVATGPGRFDEDGKLLPMHVTVGDKVLFQWGDKIEYGGKEYYLVGEGNILAIIK